MTCGRPRVSVPVLSKATAEARGLLQVRAALDEHAVPGRPRQRGEDAHRRRDDQRAGAADDEQREAAVKPGIERSAEQRRHEGHRGRQRDDHRRVAAAKRSTTVSAGARCACASSTMWTILAMVVSEAAAVARTRSVPPSMMEPANTWSPGPLATGIDSPVTGAWSAAAAPSMTTPSTAARSPGRTRTTSPRTMSATSTVLSLGPAPSPPAAAAWRWAARASSSR